MALILSCNTFAITKITFIRYIGHTCRSYLLTCAGFIMVLLDLLSEFTKDTSRCFVILLNWGIELLSVLLRHNPLR